MKTTATKYTKGLPQQVEDELTCEEMIRILVNGEPYTITMRTPGHEEALVRGILYTEDVYTDKLKAPQFNVTALNEKGFVTAINAIIPASAIQQGIATKRNLMSVTSCGMCGKEDLDLSLGDEKIESTIQIDAQQVEEMFSKMQAQQAIFQQSGGSHASCAFNANNEMLCIHEDIGRHNAVDKVIGQLLQDGNLEKAVCLTVSGRLSYEIVSKCYKARIPILASVSAPSSLAVEYCKHLGITLLAFCRESKFTVYSVEDRIKLA